MPGKVKIITRPYPYLLVVRQWQMSLVGISKALLISLSSSSWGKRYLISWYTCGSHEKCQIPYIIQAEFHYKIPTGSFVKDIPLKSKCCKFWAIHFSLLRKYVRDCNYWGCEWGLPQTASYNKDEIILIGAFGWSSWSLGIRPWLLRLVYGLCPWFILADPELPLIEPAILRGPLGICSSGLLALSALVEIIINPQWVSVITSLYQVATSLVETWSFTDSASWP